MYRPHTEYRHRPYKANTRSGADVFYVCAKIYLVLFTGLFLTRWLSERPEFQFHRIVIRGDHAVSVQDVERLVRDPMQGRLFWFWKKDNALLYPVMQVRSRIKDMDPRIATVAVSAERNRLLVDLSEFHPTYRYCLPRLGRAEGGMLSVPTDALGTVASVGTTSTSQAVGTSSMATTTATNTASFGALASSSTLQFNGGEVLSNGLIELPSPDDVGLDTHDCYWADDRGYLFARAPQYSGSPLLTVTESDPSRNETLGGKAPLGGFIFEKNAFDHLQLAIAQLTDAHYVPRRIVRMPNDDVVLDVGYPWNLAMNLKDDPKSALSHFFLSINELGETATGEKSQLKVIDVRFGNKVFYK